MTLTQRLVREPALLLGVVVAFLSLLVLFGVNLTDEQTGGIGIFLGAVIALLRFITTPASEVVVQLKPGKEVPEAAAASPIPDGQPVVVLPDAA